MCLLFPLSVKQSQPAWLVLARATLVSSSRASFATHAHVVLCATSQVGVRVASSQCSELGSAFVTILFKVADADGKEQHVPLDMSLPEFRSFAGTLRELAGKLDTV